MRYLESSTRRGAALVTAAIVGLMLAAVGGVLFLAVHSVEQSRQGTEENRECRLAAETGLNLRLVELEAGEDAPSRSYALASGASVDVTLEELDSGRVVLDAVARQGRSRFALRGLVESTQPALSPFALGALLELRIRHASRINLPFDSRLGLPGTVAVSADAALYSKGDVRLLNTASVEGDVFADSGVYVGLFASVQGLVQAPLLSILNILSVLFSDPTPPASHDFPDADALIAGRLADAVAAGTVEGDLSVSSGTVSYGPGTYVFDEIDVGSGGTLDLVGPITLVASRLTVADFGTLRAVGDVTLILDGEAAGLAMEDQSSWETVDRGDGYADLHLEILSRSSLVLSNLGFVATPPPQPEDLVLIGESGTSFRFDGLASTFFGCLYNPRGHIQFDSYVNFYGQIVGNTVDIANNTDITFDLALLNFCPRGLRPASYRRRAGGGGGVGRCRSCRGPFRLCGKTGTSSRGERGHAARSQEESWSHRRTRRPAYAGAAGGSAGRCSRCSCACRGRPVQPRAPKRTRPPGWRSAPGASASSSTTRRSILSPCISPVPRCSRPTPSPASSSSASSSRLSDRSARRCSPGCSAATGRSSRPC